MTWVLLAWTALIVVWIVSAGASNSGAVDDCFAEGVLSRQACQDATDAGTGIGVFLIVVFGAIIFMALALVWFMTRPKDKGAAALAEEMRLAREERERAAANVQ
jgi:hypothetical protein